MQLWRPRSYTICHLWTDGIIQSKSEGPKSRGVNDISCILSPQWHKFHSESKGPRMGRWAITWWCKLWYESKVQGSRSKTQEYWCSPRLRSNDAGKDGCSSSRERANLSCFFSPIQTLSTQDDAHQHTWGRSLFSFPFRMLSSSRNNFSDTHRVHVLLSTIWASISPNWCLQLTITHNINRVSTPIF